MYLLVKNIIATPRLRQQSYRTILGIQRVSKQAGTSIAEAAAVRANERGVRSSRGFTKILEALVGTSIEESSSENTDELCQSHDNIRGGSYFH